MNLDELIAMIAALQEAGTDEGVIKKMVLAALAEDTGATVEAPATDAGVGMSNEPPPDQGAAPITSQPMAARNPAPGRQTPQRPATPAARPAPARAPAPAAQNPPPANYSQRPGTHIQQLASLIGTAFGAANQAGASPRPAAPQPQAPVPARAPAAPASQNYANQPAPAAPGATIAPARTVEEQLLENTIFNTNERSGMHTGQNSGFLRRLLSSNPALYAEAISGNAPVTFDVNGSPVGSQAQPLADTAGPAGERNALARQILSYRDSETRAGRPITYNEAMTRVLQTRGMSR